MFGQPGRTAWKTWSRRKPTLARAQPPLRLKHGKGHSDVDGLPLSPTWSIKSLLPPSPPPSVITIQDLQHLLRLAQLRPPHTEYETSALVRDVNDIAHFVRHIREVDVEGVRPLRGVWRDEVGMALRNDVAEEGEASGRVLLGKAKKISGQYYAVEGGEKGGTE